MNGVPDVGHLLVQHEVSGRLHQQQAALGKGSAPAIVVQLGQQNSDSAGAVVGCDAAALHGRGQQFHPLPHRKVGKISAPSGERLGVQDGHAGYALLQKPNGGLGGSPPSRSIVVGGDQYLASTGQRGVVGFARIARPLDVADPGPSGLGGGQCCFLALADDEPAGLAQGFMEHHLKAILQGTAFLSRSALYP